MNVCEKCGRDITLQESSSKGRTVWVHLDSLAWLRTDQHAAWPAPQLPGVDWPAGQEGTSDASQ